MEKKDFFWVFSFQILIFLCSNYGIHFSFENGKYTQKYKEQEQEIKAKTYIKKILHHEIVFMPPIYPLRLLSFYKEKR